jgi:hypothetical protein
MSIETHGLAPSVYQTITASDNISNAIGAMQAFVREGDEEKFATAVALYVASARFRQEPIEQVVGALCRLVEEIEGPKRDSEPILKPSRMHELVFTGILKAFYGDIAVERSRGARAQRKADAPQHRERGTWPRRPED